MMLRGRAGLLLFFWILTGSEAVDRSKFRTCQQGSFCRRFKAWIQRPGLETPIWSVLPETKDSLLDGGLGFKVKHTHEEAAHLMLKINAYASGVVRMRLGEIDPLHVRHEIPPGDAVAEPPPEAAQMHVETSDAITKIKFQTTSAMVNVLMKHSPLAIDVEVNGRVLQRLNARNFFNFERYRKPKAFRPPDAMASLPGADGLVIDAAAHPHNLDTTGLWEEDFGGHTDRKPRGPASFGMDVTFEGNVPSLFGLPEHGTKASLPFYEEPYRFFNLDVFEYELDEPMALYGTIPILWAVHQGSGNEPSVTSGFLWINPSETFVKLERLDQGAPAGTGPAHAWWVSESGLLDVAVFVGPTPGYVSQQFHALTGFAPIPPMWALGKHQCRWNYMSEKDVATVDSSYDKYDIPYDVIWLDIEHTNGKAYFTWNDANFPTPDKMVQKISDKRRKFVNVVDPHIKKDDKFHVYTEVRDQGLFVKKVNWNMIDDPADAKPADWVEVEKIQDPTATIPEVWNEEEDGKWEPPKIDNPEYRGSWKARQIADPNSPMADFEGWCWPGTSLYPDFTDPKMREYWGSQFALDKYKGTNADLYVWNDMNEPSVFNGPEVTMPRDAIHPHGMVEHRDVHNMYGYYVHRATSEGLEKRVPGDRPFVLTRSFFIGSHKYAAIWTGDNYAKWSHLKASIAMVGALALGGQSLVGADVGGFFKHPDVEMMVRWYQLAVLAYPFLRNHAHLETPRREPYVFGDLAMKRLKATLQLRYKLLPLFYTLFNDYHRYGAPVVRPLFYDFLDDPLTHAGESAVEDQIMLGDAVLVHGVTQPMSDTYKEASVYLPVAAGWYDMHDLSFHAPGFVQVPLTMDQIPSYYRAGAIVPVKTRMRRSSSCMALDPLTLYVFLDPSTGTAAGQLYVDDYKTKQYQDGSSFLSVSLEYKDGILHATSATGVLPEGLAAEVERVEVHGLKREPASAVLDVTGEKQTQLTKPISVPRGSLFSSTIKVVPFLDLRKGTAWSLQIA
mmetsp:Transcript_10527/g.27890  ORF Transcript_10527/g.27890 Transcript_10527/m.27890 type:complete len:1009 (+) Transcript_10527:124-3150(+)